MRKEYSVPTSAMKGVHHAADVFSVMKSALATVMKHHLFFEMKVTRYHDDAFVAGPLRKIF